jgi:hypothetical protein
MKTPAFFLVALAMSVSAFSQTSAPAAPTLTAGAEFKGLRLDWTPVSGASWYQLELRAHQTGPFVQQGGNLPATTTSTRFTFPLHFYDWTYARYRVAACNSAGCSRSAEVSVSNLRRDAVGYFKAGQSVGGASFGDSTDLSPDGNNMVASAPFEYTSTTTDTVSGGAAYVFGRDSSGKWFQRVRFQKDVVASYDEDIRMDVAVSASGNTVAIGMPTTKVAGSTQEGEVDIYHFKNGLWARTRIPRLPVANFGGTVALDDSGFILAVGLWDSAKSVAIYKSINSVWTHVHDISLNEQDQEKCDKPVMSRDGKVIAERCEQAASGGIPRRDYIRVHSGANWEGGEDIFLRYAPFTQTHYYYGGIGIDRTGQTIAVQFSEWTEGTQDGKGAVEIFKRYNGGSFSIVNEVKPGAWRMAAERYTYGDTVSVSGDGLTIAVGDPKDNGTSVGPRAAPLVSGTDQTGAVYVYHLLNDKWLLASMVKPNYKPADPLLVATFGNRSALNGDGRTLIIPMPDEASSASGIDGNWANDDRGYSGAIFMY